MPEARGAQSEAESLRQLARQIAATSDTQELLSLLCVAAAEHCEAGGAAVVEADGDTGNIVAACGFLAPAQGRHFQLRGSLFQEMQQRRDVVGVDDIRASARPITTAVPEVHIGPMLVAPLIAHSKMIGGLAIAREPDAGLFTPEQNERLRLIADHASFALWKSELLEEARSADAAKARFLATISHELRTPLTALTGYEELLVDEVLGPLSAPQRDVLERMRSVTHNLTVMIEDVLAYSSLEMGHEVIRPTDFLLGDLVRAVMAVAEPLARQKNLELLLEMKDDSVRLVTDIDRARQILVNLAGNAVKFTDKGSVKISAKVDKSDVRLAVIDSGIGIAPQHQRMLFKPFAQVDTGLTRRHGGTGLGLYISSQLAKLLGGRIELQSELGRGSVFTLILPLGR
ncbi:MAG TPA: ATP-binding protein [Gemmatimonadaceae bacterium]